MITLLVVAVLGVLLILVLKKLFEKPARSAALPPKPVEDVANVKPADARVGDSISVAGAGDQFSDLDFTVESRNDYDLGPRRWIELRGMYRNRRVMLEITVEDETEVNLVTDARRITLDELALSENDLGELDQRQNASDFFEFEGKNWYYRLSREFGPGRYGQGPSFYGWVFREDGTNRIMLVRKAEGEPFGAVIGVGINPGDVTVYRA